MAAMIGDDGEDSESDSEGDDEDDDSEGAGELEVQDDGLGAELDDGEGPEGDDWVDDELDLEEAVEGGEGGEGDDFEHLGTAPLRDGDDADSEDSYGDEQEFLNGELEFDPDMEDQPVLSGRVLASGGGFGWDALGTGEGAVGRRNRLLGASPSPLIFCTVLLNLCFVSLLQPTT